MASAGTDDEASSDRRGEERRGEERLVAVEWREEGREGS